jgi:hypothetical protein
MHGNIPSTPTGQADRRDRAGNAVDCEHCGRTLQPKPGSRRQRFCNDACRQAEHRLQEKAGGSIKSAGVHVDPPGFPLSRSNPIDPVAKVEANLIACLGDLGDLEPKRREFWLRRAHAAAEQIAASRLPALPAPGTFKRPPDPAFQAKVDKHIAEIPADLSIPSFLRRTPC